MRKYRKDSNPKSVSTTFFAHWSLRGGRTIRRMVEKSTKGCEIQVKLGFAIGFNMMFGRLGLQVCSYECKKH